MAESNQPTGSEEMALSLSTDHQFTPTPEESVIQAVNRFRRTSEGIRAFSEAGFDEKTLSEFLGSMTSSQRSDGTKGTQGTTEGGNRQSNTAYQWMFKKMMSILGVYLQSIEAREPRFFFIHNSWANKVLDVVDNDKSPGAHLITYRKKDPPSDNQLWYFDENGYIRSKLHGFYIDTSGTWREDGIFYTYARLKPKSGLHFQQWQYNKETQSIQRADDQYKVLDIKWGSKVNCCKIIEHKYHGGKSQCFELNYTNITGDGEPHVDRRAMNKVLM